jgi:hypothetical protein
LKLRTDVAGIALCGFAATGLLAGGLLDAVPESVRVVVAFAALIVAPAFLLRPLASRALGLREPPALESLAPAVLMVLSAHALIAQLFLLARAPFSVYSHTLTWIVLLFHLCVLVAAVYRRVRMAAWRVSVSGCLDACSCAGLASVSAASTR